MRRAACILLGLIALRTGSAATVGVLDAGADPRALDAELKALRMLGHHAERLPEAALFRPTGVGHLDCILVSQRGGDPTEPACRALETYVAEGGTLLLAGAAGAWVRTPGGARPRERMGGRLLNALAGAALTGQREAAIVRLAVVSNTPATAGLPASFALQPQPPWTVEDPVSWRGCGAFALRAGTAAALLRADLVDASGAAAAADVLTVREHGRGRCYRLGLSRIAPLAIDRRERTIAHLLDALLRSTEAGP